MGVHETSAGRANVTRKMARDRTGSDYSENLSDATSCSCMTSSVDKEPFFLHPPGSRPRDGIYINPMSGYIGEPARPKDGTTESFYLHSPHDLVYTRITHLFGEAEKPRNGLPTTTTAMTTTTTTDQQQQQQQHHHRHRHAERKDETLTVKVDVHINNNGSYAGPVAGNGHAPRTDIARDSGEHAYEQICIRQEETSSVGSSTHKKMPDNVSESSRSRKASRRFSRSSSASESSNMSSEIHCFSSTTSTPSLSRNSSNERIGKLPKANPEPHLDRKGSPSGQVESEKEIRPASNGPALPKPPPPPPPPPPDNDDVVVLVVAGKHTTEVNVREEKKDTAETGQDSKGENNYPTSAANKSDVEQQQQQQQQQQPEVPPAVSPHADPEQIKTSQQPSHLASRHMVLPFIPPQFANAADSDTLLKPSEYLKSICKATAKGSLSKARSVDNLDIQGRESEQPVERSREAEEDKGSPPGPPPPPLSPLQKSPKIGARSTPSSGSSSSNSSTAATTPAGEHGESPKSAQPLATISIQDLTSIQLRRTSTKMNATKTFSAPPPRSVSMTNVSEPFFVQKTDLIAELKKTKDIPGIKKLKVERAQVEKTQEQNLILEINKAFSVSNFVDQIPEKDSSGNVIPIWKRQMLARKAAERAKKELEEQIARENEERRQKAIPPWKRQLLAKKDNEEKKLGQINPSPATAPAPVAAIKIDVSPSPKREPSPIVARSRKEKTESEEKRSETNDDSDDGPIIPWRAQLRKTNSKLNILD